MEGGWTGGRKGKQRVGMFMDPQLKFLDPPVNNQDLYLKVTRELALVL
jgi:hypothetical protein